MVEGDLVDLSLPTLLHAVAREGSTSVLRLQRGADQGALYFFEGSLVHAQAGQTSGDEAVGDLLGWGEGRFRLARDPVQQPRTVTQKLAQIVTDSGPGRASSQAASPLQQSGDEQLLSELLTLLSRLDQDKARLEDGRVEAGSVNALVVVAAAVNSLVAVVTARCSDPDVLPSRVLPRLADEHPYTQMLGEDMDRISVATAAGMLNAYGSATEERRQLYGELCRALLHLLKFYGNAASTFFRGSREREEWRATFGVFADGLWSAAQASTAAA